MRKTPLTNPKPETHCSAVILSGGLNSRMSGRNKAFLEVGGQSILDRLLGTLGPIFNEILLVTRDPDVYAGMSLKVVLDLYKDRSSLTGIHAGLVNAGTRHALVVPCDAPFLQPAVIQLLLDALEPELDVVIPMLDGHYQPLCAIYSKRCIPVIENQLQHGDYKIIEFFDRVKLKTISPEQIKAADPKLLSFLNINTPSALRECEAMIRD